jgi:SAM-dependent methyltransferase
MYTSRSQARRIAQVRAFVERTGGIHRLQMNVDGAVERIYDAVAALPRVNEGYMNYGYWSPGTTSVAEASDNLMKVLVTGLQPGGRVLDVACGLGATTRFLCRHWPPEAVVGVNLTERQVSRCRENAPHCQFLVMDATTLSFDAESFESVICVEAALHFRTRRRFLEHAWRILKKDGTLAMSDVLLHPEGHEFLPMLMPSENYLSSAEAYRELLLDVGFASADVTDITDIGWSKFARHELSQAHESWLTGASDFDQLQARLSFVYIGAAVLSSNVLCFARK